MGLFSKIFNNHSQSFGSKMIDKLGYEDASIYLYGIVSSKFNFNDTQVLLLQLKQFVREEFDAASQGNVYSKKFVRTVCPDKYWYKDAMGEDPEYPIDEEDGPQQTILKIILPIIEENAELAIKLRCDIVNMIYEDFQVLQSESMDIPVSESIGYTFKKRRERLYYIVKNKT